MTCAACASTQPVGSNLLTGTCAEEYRGCTQTPGDQSYCEDQREACQALEREGRERASEKQRDFEEFKREREDAQ